LEERINGNGIWIKIFQRKYAVDIYPK